LQFQFGRTTFDREFGTGGDLRKACGLGLDCDCSPELAINDLLAAAFSRVVPSSCKPETQSFFMFMLERKRERIKIQILNEAFSGDLIITDLYKSSRGEYKWDWFHNSGLTVRLQLLGKEHLSGELEESVRACVSKSHMRNNMVVLTPNQGFTLGKYWKAR
jgi:hypothetical protein